MSDASPFASLRNVPIGHGVILALFSLAAAVLLAATYDATSDAIAARKKEDLLYSLAQVLPDKIHDNDPSTTLRTIADEAEGEVQIYLAAQGSAVTGTAFELTGFGYGGAIRVLIGVAPDGTLLGARVLAHAETPGLGDKIEARRSDWIDGFIGRSLTDPTPDGWKVQKDGGIFDQFSGATITPRAVVNTVHRGLTLFSRHKAELLAPLEETGS